LPDLKLVGGVPFIIDEGSSILVNLETPSLTVRCNFRRYAVGRHAVVLLGSPDSCLTVACHMVEALRVGMSLDFRLSFLPFHDFRNVGVRREPNRILN